MLSPGRTSILSNARTLLLNRRYSSSIAVTSRSNVFTGLHKNDFLRSNGDNSAQAFHCLQQRGLRTKAKTSDAKPSDSSSNDSEPLEKIRNYFRKLNPEAANDLDKWVEAEKEAFKKIDKIVANRQQFGSYEEYLKAYSAANKEYGEKMFTKNERILFYTIGLILVLGLPYLAYKLVRRMWSQNKNPPSQTGSHSTWNALSPPVIESDLEKKELKTGNEFDLNALLPTTENDSGKHHSYSEYK
ncbi:hypothetical protein Ddc_15404 [Ditylenchus destructor]|nr:hypothetical protein Ddc_15404 [Ditylenchus destructor]